MECWQAWHCNAEFSVCLRDHAAAYDVHRIHGGVRHRPDALETFRKVALSRYEELLDTAGDEEEE